jgi:hypothetical protein
MRLARASLIRFPTVLDGEGTRNPAPGATRHTIIVDDL